MRPSPLPALRRFVRYSAYGLATFVLDLGLLALLTSYLGVSYLIATPVALLIAVSINYLFTRAHVFRGTTQTAGRGYFNYLLLAALGAVVITAAVYLLVTYLGMQYLLARVLVGVVTGVANYLLNLYWNFRVAGRHV